MVILMLKLTVAPKDRVSVIKTIHPLIGPTSVKAGCICCKLYASTMNDDELIFIEKWESQKELEKHIRSDDFQRILIAMDASADRPELTFNLIETVAGFEYLENLMKA